MKKVNMYTKRLSTGAKLTSELSLANRGSHSPTTASVNRAGEQQSLRMR